MTAALELRSITKIFGDVVANDHVTLSVDPGEIFALVGENGAGKTTLMNVAYGLYRPDAGEIFVRGEKARIRGPKDAIRHGIGMVHQHFMLVGPLTVAENVVLGREPRRRGLFDHARAEQEVAQVSERYGFGLDPRARVEDLTVAEQQRVEIVKALWRGAEILILDEPTAVLSPQQAEELYRVVASLAEGGKTIIFISHKLREVLASARRVGVMRRGQLVSVVEARGTDPDKLAELMVGGRPPNVPPRESGPAKAPKPLLSVRDVCAPGDRKGRALEDVRFELHAGEILAVAGVEGNGQAELADVLTGMRRCNDGVIRLMGEDVTRSSARALRRAGIGSIPEDRHRRGLCLDMSVAENMSLGRHASPPFARKVGIDFAGRAEAARRLVAEYEIFPPDPDESTRVLSGGNQQKVILARELDARPKVLIAVQPTRGLDVRSVEQVHARLRAHRQAGGAVLLFSLDLDEIMALADRVMVLYGGKVTGLVERREATEALVGRLMLGGTLDDARREVVRG